MAIPNEPLTRTEQYLNRTATGSGTIPDDPLTRVEMYLNKIATGDGDVPEVPLTRMEQYLAYIAENGSGGGGNPNTQQTIVGTAANPWGDVSYSELAAALANGDAHAVIRVQMGETGGRFSLISHDGITTYAGHASIGTTIVASSAAEFNWNENGSINYIRGMAGGQIQDYTAYAAGMQTGLTIYWHPMP